MRLSRRHFFFTAAGGVLGSGLAKGSASGDKLAILGGTPVRKKGFPSWPMVGENDVKSWIQTLRSRKWCRIGGNRVSGFERAFSELLGARFCLATTNGTNALFTALNALGVGPGDEVIVPPYTFVATVNVVLLQHALPVFVDTDRQSFQIDARKIEASMTSDTRAILPVHLGGLPSDMDTIAALAKKRGVPVVEDACQAHLAEWRGRRVGSLGEIGCFSFQETKNLSSGEGGMLATSDEKLYDLSYSFQTNGRARKGGYGFAYPFQGSNVRMTEFQGALLLAQMTRLEAQATKRDENAAHLTRLLSEIPGIHPARPYPGTTRNAYHLYMMRYDPEAFAGVPRDQFLRALRAEGIPCSGGYSPLNKEPFLARAFASRAYRRIYSKERLQAWEDRNRCPENDRLCREAVWLFQSLFLAEKRDMDDIAAAIARIRKQAPELKARATG